MLLGDVMGGPQPFFSFDLFMEIQTGNHSYRCDLSHEQSHLPTLNCQKNKKQADLDVTKGHQLWGMISADVHLYTCMLEVYRKLLSTKHYLTEGNVHLPNPETMLFVTCSYTIHSLSAYRPCNTPTT